MNISSSKRGESKQRILHCLSSVLYIFGPTFKYINIGIEAAFSSKILYFCIAIASSQFEQIELEISEGKQLIGEFLIENNFR